MNMKIVHANEEKTFIVPVEDEILFTESAVREIIDRVLMSKDLGNSTEKILKKSPMEWL